MAAGAAPEAKDTPGRHFAGWSAARCWRAPYGWEMAVPIGLAWLLRYCLCFGLHLDRAPAWAGYFDQDRYLWSAQALAHGDLSPARHWYPLAYSLTASPFARWLPHEPFFVPDLLLFVAAGIAFATSMARAGVHRWAAVGAFLLATLLLAKPAKLWLEPWTTTLSAALIWGLIATAAALIDAGDRRARNRSPTGGMAALGLFLGLLPTARPTDLIVAIPIVIAVLLLLWRQRRLRWIGCACLTAGALGPLLLYLLLHLSIYGARASDYMIAARNQGFAFADLPWKAYVVLIRARPWFPDAKSLSEGFPLLLPGLTGLLARGLRNPRRINPLWVLIGLAAIPYAALYLAYTDLQPSGLWKYNNAHYFKWLFPLFGVGLWLLALELRSLAGAARAIAAVLICVVPACILLSPVPTGADQPTRLLIFHGDTGRAWSDAYFAPAMITDRLGRLANVRDFHQIPIATGEEAIAITRLFAADPRRFDPGETPPWRGPQPPYARYRVALSLGLPCWLRVSERREAGIANPDTRRTVHPIPACATTPP